MADEKKDDKKIVNAAPDQEFNDDGSKNPDFVKPTKEGEGAKKPDGSEKKTGEDDKGKDKKPEEAEFDDNIDPAKPPEIPVRKSVLQHIIARKDKKIKKLKSEIDDKDEDTDEGDDEDKDEDKEDDGLTDEARGAINKTVKKQIAPILKTLISDADENELKALFTSEPEAKKYEKHIRAYMGHDVYKGVAPSVIYHHLAFQTAQATGAKKKKVADFEAEQNRGGGRVIQPRGSIGDLPTAEEIADMSEAEFERMEADARQGKYVNK